MTITIQANPVGPIDHKENRPVFFPFSKAIGTATITSATVEVLLVSGEDASPNSIKSGSALIDNTTKIVSQNFAPLNKSGNTYDVRCIAQISNGDTIVIAAMMPVVTL